MPHLDILIFAIIAVVILARLWMVFGRRNEEDRQRSNPFATPAPPPGSKDSEAIIGGRKQADPAQMAKPVMLLGSAPASLAGGLERIKQADPLFDEKQFLRTARESFTKIVAAFAKGDLAEVSNLLAPPIQTHFQTAIDARKQVNETLESRIAVIRDVETVSAGVDDTRTIVGVRFISDQENILFDGEGKIVSGEKGTVQEITDLWTFAHDTKSGSPDWQLIETK